VDVAILVVVDVAILVVVDVAILVAVIVVAAVEEEVGEETAAAEVDAVEVAPAPEVLLPSRAGKLLSSILQNLQCTCDNHVRKSIIILVHK